MYLQYMYMYLRTNSDLCHLQHKLNGFYNPDEKCLLRGTNWRSEEHTSELQSPK
jgi:hypothetical protein